MKVKMSEDRSTLVTLALIFITCQAAVFWANPSSATVFAHPVEPLGSLIGEHICYRNESFTELEQRRSTEPVRIREYGWCLGFPPRCSKYRTETKEIIKYHNVTKQRVIKECCEGFVETPTSSSSNTTRRCLPTCPNGCENGVCSRPFTCECLVGYQGGSCGKACDRGTFGLNCQQKCDCPSSSCDPVSGVCIECLEGWTGPDCNTKCLKSFFGRDCKFKCDSCPEQECDSKSGECLIKATTTTLSPTTTPATTLSPPPPPPTTTFSSVTAVRPKLPTTSAITDPEPEQENTSEHSTSTSNFSNPSSPRMTQRPRPHPTESSVHVSNSMAITVLNTSISSLETDVKKLERQVDEHKRLIVSTTTTPVPVPGLTFVHLPTVGTLTAEDVAAVAVDPNAVLISTHHHDNVPAIAALPPVAPTPLEPLAPEVVVHWEAGTEIGGLLHDLHHNLNNTKIEDRVDRHGSILIALIAALCVVCTGVLGYVCLRWRCFVFPVKSSKVAPRGPVELVDVRALPEKPLPALPAAHEGSRSRSGSVKSVTFDEKLTYYEDGKAPMITAEGIFVHHVYDEVKYPPPNSQPPQPSRPAPGLQAPGTGSAQRII